MFLCCELKAQTFEIKPGKGVYIPWSGPHWVMVDEGDYPVSINVSFRTRETEHKRRIQMTNHQLRKLKIEPALLGKSPIEDKLTELTYQVKEQVFKTIG